MLQLPDHPLHAELHEMASEHSPRRRRRRHLRPGRAPALGVRAISAQPTPLGDVARAFRREKLAAKKAEIVFEKQGS